MALGLSMLLPTAPPGPRRAGSNLAPAAVLVPAPAYYRPVVVDGKTFPLARSNYFSLVEFVDDWHAVRLRLVDGKWLPIGLHEGVDITSEAGTPIVAMAPGHVENVGWTFYSGTRVGIRGDDGRYYFYAHMSAVASGIADGARVATGQMLGRVGNTGYGDPGTRDQFPPHLHFGIMVGAGWVSPYPLLSSLYRAAVGADQRGQAELVRLAEEGRAGPWKREAGRLFASFTS